MPARSIPILFLSALLLAGCAPEPSPLAAQLRQEFQPGLSLAEASEHLLAHGAVFTLSSATQCKTQMAHSALAAELSPRGGPCIFGKIAVTRNWLGGRSDVILQLVFSSEGTLADGNFEELASGF
jgi:hypothetical protein